MKLKACFVALLLLWMLVAPSQAQAQNVPLPKYEADIQTAILFGSFDTKEAVERGNSQIRALYLRLTRETKAKQDALRAAAMSQEQRKKLSRQIAQLRAQQEQLMSQLAAMDVYYKVSLRAYREGLTGFLESADPRYVDALRRYAEGDASALDDIQEITRIRRAASVAGLQARNGEEQRKTARLWTEAKDLGQRTTLQVLQAWREAATVDPANFETWQTIATISLDSADYEGAEAASKQALAKADTAVERGAAELLLGIADSKLGHSSEARDHFQNAVDASRRAVSASPGNVILRRDLAASLNNFADSESQLHNLDSAERAYREALAIRRSIQAANPNTRGAYRDLGVEYGRLGLFLSVRRNNYLEGQRYLASARAIFSNLQQMNADSSAALFDVIVAIEMSARAAYSNRDWAPASEYSEEGFPPAVVLWNRDRTNALYRSEIDFFLYVSRASHEQSK